jgi:hypothetical protein
MVPAEAYVAAAIAAFHPKPHEQTEFLGSQGLMGRIKVASVAWNLVILTREGIGWSLF